MLTWPADICRDKSNRTDHRESSRKCGRWGLYESNCFKAYHTCY